MADLTITQLPADVTLTGTEEVPIMDSGVTKKTTVQDIANLAAGGVSSVNGETGAVVLDAADVGADAAGTASGLIAAHVAAADPHPGYLTHTEGNAAYAPIAHISSTSNPHSVTATQVGFGNKSTLDKISESVGLPTWNGEAWPSTAPVHNDLGGLQGGTAGEYYHLTDAELIKLSGIAAGAEVNVNADWNAVSGDAQILNKPATFTPSAHTTGSHSDWPATVDMTEVGYLDGVTSGIQAQIDNKQATLVSGTNIKTINGSSVLGSGDLIVTSSVADGDKGDITISNSGATWTVDSVDGNLDFLGTAARIRGDFTNPTVANRTMFQTSATNQGGVVGVIPDGTGVGSGWRAYSTSDPANSTTLALVSSSTQVHISSEAYGTATPLPMTFHTGGSERMRIDTSGNVGIGTTSPAAKLDVTVDTAVKVYAQTWNVYNGASFQCTNVLGGDSTNGVYFGPFQSVPLRFTTGNNERMRIDAAGNVLVTNPAGLGYGTGAGGTVTQATSKSTAVTLNKPCGQITMHNAALAANTSVAFQFNNTLISAGDVLLVNPSNNGNYLAQTVYTANGHSAILITNISAGSLSEALVINFAVIKGAIS